jgi:hypothetical protein
MTLILSGTDGLSDVDGSAATPAIRGTDANTGIFFPAADTIAFSEGGVEAARFDSAGNLGIGTVSPAQTLHVKTSTASTPITLGVLSDATNLAALSFNGAYASTTMSGTYYSSGGLNHTVPSGSTYNFRIADSVKMTLDASGNLGIGTSSPTAMVDISKSSSGTSGGQYPALQVINTNTSGNSLAAVEIKGTNGSIHGQIAALNDGVRVAALSNHYLQFMTNSSERARITSAGDLLVGRISLVDFEKFGVEFDTATANGALFRSSSSTAGNMIIFRTASGQIGSITTNGTSSTAYNTSSDYRLKENVAPMTGALAKVAALKPVTYKWKVDGSDGEGFIAHELAEVVTQCVTGEKDAVNEDGSIKPQGIDTSFLVATLTAAIQEQQALITTLTDRITALEAK